MALHRKQVVHIPDVRAEPEYTWTRSDRLGDVWRSQCSAFRCCRENVLIGVFVVTATRCVRSPTSRSSCVENFADQAVIAIENTRLLNELQARIARTSSRRPASRGRCSRSVKRRFNVRPHGQCSKTLVESRRRGYARPRPGDDLRCQTKASVILSALELTACAQELIERVRDQCRSSVGDAIGEAAEQRTLIANRRSTRGVDPDHL